MRSHEGTPDERLAGLLGVGPVVGAVGLATGRVATTGVATALGGVLPEEPVPEEPDTVEPEVGPILEPLPSAELGRWVDEPRSPCTMTF